MGTFSSDPRHSLATQRHIFEKGINICTSFNPSTMSCNTCTDFEHPVLQRMGSKGQDIIEPKCFVLGDQCFPPVLPSGGEGDCLAIILIENGTLMELADSFLDLAKGYDMPVGSVVVLSSVSLLARIGTAAYAEEVVRAFARIREPTPTLSGWCMASLSLSGGWTMRLSSEACWKFNCGFQTVTKGESILCPLPLSTSSLNG